MIHTKPTKVFCFAEKNNTIESIELNLANYMINNKVNNFWAEIKKMKGNVGNLPMSVNGVSGESNIANLFSEKYKELFSCVSYDSDIMFNLKQQTEKNVQRLCIHGKCYNSHCINVDDIRESIRQLKLDKSDGTTLFNSCHVIYASRKLSVYLCLLFNAMMKYNYIPEDVLVSTIVPIPKNRQSLCNSDNYRGIALFDILGKL